MTRKFEEEVKGAVHLRYASRQPADGSLVWSANAGRRSEGYLLGKHCRRDCHFYTLWTCNYSPAMIHKLLCYNWALWMYDVIHYNWPIIYDSWMAGLAPLVVGPSPCRFWTYSAPTPMLPFSDTASCVDAQDATISIHAPGLSFGRLLSWYNYH